MSDNEKVRRLGSRQKVLNALEIAGEKGVTNVDLVRICFRYGARLFELRNLGHNIVTLHEQDGVFRFVLRASVPTQLTLLEGIHA